MSLRDRKEFEISRTSALLAPCGWSFAFSLRVLVGQRLSCTTCLVLLDFVVRLFAGARFTKWVGGLRGIH